MRKITLLFLLLLLISRVNGQSEKYPLISGDFKNVSVEKFLDSLQFITTYHFYYDKNYLPNETISFTANRLPLNILLDSVFNQLPFQSNIHFSIFEKSVFITKGLSIQTNYPDFNIDIVKKNDNSGIDKTDNKIVHDSILKVIQPENNEQVRISGYVKDAKSGEPVVGAVVTIQNTSINTISDQFGYFVLILTRGNYILNVQSLGMSDYAEKIIVSGDDEILINLKSKVLTLKGVTISSQKSINIKGTQLGLQKLDMKSIKQVPVVFGEVDILRTLLSLPGVKTVGEASTGLNIRGGSVDQNLILFNDLNIYNPTHFFGLFSAFNPETVKDVELFKGSIPANYGGRLSSVLNINSKEGNKKKFGGSAGIGLLTSRLNVEGPLKKDRSSFIIGSRTTYANWLLKYLPNNYSNSKTSFYDIDLVTTHEINSKNSLYFTGYISQDKFNLNTDTSYRYRNRNLGMRWKHTYNNKLMMLFSTGYNYYSYQIGSSPLAIYASTLKFDVNHSYLNFNFNYIPNVKHYFQFGLNNTFYKLHPGELNPATAASQITPKKIEAEQALESALFISDKYAVNKTLSVDAGLRLSAYNQFGPYTINEYTTGQPISVNNITGTKSYGNAKIIKTYWGPELRIGVRQMLSKTSSLKFAYNNLRQYIHLLSNTAAMAPTDIWKLSTPHILPQLGNQFSLGLYKNLRANTVEISLEGYYKRMKNYLDYKSGAELVLNSHIETDVMKTQGKAYGMEFLVRKVLGKLNGWVGYTYSRILLKANHPETEEYINNGKWYPSSYDKPHDLVIVANYSFLHRLTTSFNATYSTGRPITLPIGKYYYLGSYRTLYANRNEYRIPNYFRIDLAINLDGNYKINQKMHNSWTVGVYNLTGRKNPYSVYYVSEGGLVNGYKLSIFGSVIPYINFNVRF